MTPPKPIADLVIREVPGDVLHFQTTDPAIAERLRVEFEAGEFGTFGVHDKEHRRSAASGYLHFLWPFDIKKLASHMGEIAKCKYVIEFRIENFVRQEREVIKGDSSG